MKAGHIALLALAVAVYALVAKPSANVAESPKQDGGSWYDGILGWWD